jgi:excisionase family DNA binding protein
MPETKANSGGEISVNDDLLAIGEVARCLELSVEKVRKLADSDELPCERTPGGHRRFREDDVAAYEEGREVTRRTATQPRQPRHRSPKRRVLYAPIFDDYQEDWENTDLDELHKLEEPAQRPVSQMVKRVPQQPAQVQLPTLDDKKAKREQEELQRKTEEEERRLQSLKNKGLASIPWDVPATWRARVVADLERYVTPQNFPSWISSYDQLNMVKARVEDALQPYRDQQAKEREKREADAARASADAERQKAKADREAAKRQAEEDAQRRIQSLVSHGRMYATRSLRSVDARDRYRIRRDIESALNEEVESDWTDGDVEDLVDEVLGDWRDDDDG